MSKENAKKLLEELGKRPELQKKVKELEAAAQKIKMEGLAKVAADLKLPFTAEELAAFMGQSDVLDKVAGGKVPRLDKVK